MKLKVTLATLMCILFSLPILAENGNNLVKNGDFSASINLDEASTHWTSQRSGGDMAEKFFEYVKDEQAISAPTLMIKMNNSYAFIRQHIAVTPGQVYQIQFKARIQDKEGFASTATNIGTGNKKNVPHEILTTILNNTGKTIKGFIAKNSKNETLKYEIKIPDDVNEIILSLGKKSGILYLDNIYMGIGEPKDDTEGDTQENIQPKVTEAILKGNKINDPRFDKESLLSEENGWISGRSGKDMGKQFFKYTKGDDAINGSTLIMSALKSYSFITKHIKLRPATKYIISFNYRIQDIEGAYAENTGLYNKQHPGQPKEMHLYCFDGKKRFIYNKYINNLNTHVEFTITTPSDLSDFSIQFKKFSGVVYIDDISLIPVIPEPDPSSVKVTFDYNPEDGLYSLGALDENTRIFVKTPSDGAIETNRNEDKVSFKLPNDAIGEYKIFITGAQMATLKITCKSR